MFPPIESTPPDLQNSSPNKPLPPALPVIDTAPKYFIQDI